MTIDEILEIGIDGKERLYLRPNKERFILIYETATEVHWDNDGLFLYSPKPREWKYFEWYKHIIGVIAIEFNSKFLLTERT